MLVLFDGTCGVCRRSAAWLARHNPDVFEFRASQSVSDEALADLGLTRHNVQTAVWIVTPEGPVGAERAIALMLRRAHGAWPVLGLLMDLPGVRKVSGVFYRTFAKNRHRLPSSTCEVV